MLPTCFSYSPPRSPTFIKAINNNNLLDARILDTVLNIYSSSWHKFNSVKPRWLPVSVWCPKWPACWSHPESSSSLSSPSLSCWCVCGSSAGQSGCCHTCMKMGQHTPLAFFTLTATQVEGGSEFSGQLSVQYRRGMLSVIIYIINNENNNNNDWQS